METVESMMKRRDGVTTATAQMQGSASVTSVAKRCRRAVPAVAVPARANCLTPDPVAGGVMTDANGRRLSKCRSTIR